MKIDNLYYIIKKISQYVDWADEMMTANFISSFNNQVTILDDNGYINSLYWMYNDDYSNIEIDIDIDLQGLPDEYNIRKIKISTDIIVLFFSDESCIVIDDYKDLSEEDFFLTSTHTNLGSLTSSELTDISYFVKNIIKKTYLEYNDEEEEV